MLYKGKVSTIDASGSVRVLIPEKDNYITAPLPIFGSGTVSINEDVILIFFEDSSGVVLTQFISESDIDLIDGGVF